MLKLRLTVTELVRGRAGMQTQDCLTPKPVFLNRDAALVSYRHGNEGLERCGSLLGTEPVIGLTINSSFSL